MGAQLGRKIGTTWQEEHRPSCTKFETASQVSNLKYKAKKIENGRKGPGW